MSTDTRYIKRRERPTYRPLHAYERQMVDRMVAFTQRHPHHIPWEKLVRIARNETEGT